MRRSNLKKLIDTSTNVHYFAYCILKLLHGVYKIRTKVDLRENVFEKQWWMFTWEKMRRMHLVKNFTVSI